MWIFTFWSWWILAAGLMTFEVILPSTYFLWSGIAAAIVGLILWLFPGLDIAWQIFIFAVMSVASVLAYKAMAGKNSEEVSQNGLNARAQQYVGRVFTLEQPIKNGFGYVRVNDSRWKIMGPDCDSGTQVKVTDIQDSCIFKVEAVS